jgi:putative NADH-flavin reductase
VLQGDATDPSTLAPLLAGHDAVVSASQFQTSDVNALIAAVKKAGVNSDSVATSDRR